MGRVNIGVIAGYVLFAVIIALCAIGSAHADTPVGWKVVFGLNCSPGTVELGANDAGSGYSRIPVTGPVNMDVIDGYSSRIRLGSTTSFVDSIMIEPQAEAPKMFDLNWLPYNWDPLWLYQQGNLWPMFNVVGVLREGNDTTILDLTKTGSVTLMAGYDSSLMIYANQPVPEPSSILALMTGFAGLGGFALRKR
jgi:hypothetical protein